MKKYKFYFMAFFLGLSFIPSVYSFRFKSLLRCIPCCRSRSVEPQVHSVPAVAQAWVSSDSITKVRVEPRSDEHVHGASASLQLDLDAAEPFEFVNISNFQMIIEIGDRVVDLKPDDNFLIEEDLIGLGFSIKIPLAFIGGQDSILCFVSDASFWKWFSKQMIRSCILFLEIKKGSVMPYLVFESIESVGSINRFILNGFKQTM